MPWLRFNPTSQRSAGRSRPLAEVCCNGARSREGSAGGSRCLVVSGCTRARAQRGGPQPPAAEARSLRPHPACAPQASTRAKSARRCMPFAAAAGEPRKPLSYGTIIKKRRPEPFQRFGALLKITVYRLVSAVSSQCSRIFSRNHSGQRQGRRVTLSMKPSCVQPVLSSSCASL